MFTFDGTKAPSFARNFVINYEFSFICTAMFLIGSMGEIDNIMLEFVVVV